MFCVLWDKVMGNPNCPIVHTAKPLDHWWNRTAKEVIECLRTGWRGRKLLVIYCRRSNRFKLGFYKILPKIITFSQEFSLRFLCDWILQFTREPYVFHTRAASMPLLLHNNLFLILSLTLSFEIFKTFTEPPVSADKFNNNKASAAWLVSFVKDTDKCLTSWGISVCNSEHFWAAPLTGKILTSQKNVYQQCSGHAGNLHWALSEANV